MASLLNSCTHLERNKNSAQHFQRREKQGTVSPQLTLWGQHSLYSKILKGYYKKKKKL